MLISDSVIYLSKRGDWDPPTGDSLGEWTNELDGYGEGSYIKEFVSCGPKQYSYKAANGEGKIVGVVMKAKGFSLNHSTAAHLNFDRLKRQVFRFHRDGDTDGESVAVYNKVIRRTKEHRLVTKTERKVQKLVYKKRILQYDYTTLPYGY